MVFVQIENNRRVPHCLKLRRDCETDLVVRERRALAGGIPHRCNTQPFRHCERNWLHANAVSSRRSGKFRPPSLAPLIPYTNPDRKMAGSVMSSEMRSSLSTSARTRPPTHSGRSTNRRARRNRCDRSSARDCLPAGIWSFVTAWVRNKVSQAADTASEPRLTTMRGSMTHLHPPGGAITFGLWAAQ
jgi:hypothetical protein